MIIGALCVHLNFFRVPTHEDTRMLICDNIPTVWCPSQLSSIPLWIFCAYAGPAEVAAASRVENARHDTYSQYDAY
jgi:hypothetical protein